REFFLEVVSLSHSSHSELLAGRPATIPALREWRSSGPDFTLTRGTHLLANTPELASVAEVFSEDVQRLTGLDIPVLASRGARVGDSVLELDDIALPSGDTGDQGYELEIGAQVIIRAQTAQGIFYGTRTVLQLLAQNLSLPGGLARDWPDYPQRGFM